MVFLLQWLISFAAVVLRLLAVSPLSWTFIDLQL